jgi:uncharacterized repeat protein (TIGR03803 family)
LPELSGSNAVKDLFAIAVATMLGLAGVAAAQTPTETVLYSFKGDANGSYPLAPLITDARGALYGTTEGYHSHTKNQCGNAFMLEPPKDSGKPWGYHILHVFIRGKTDGCDPWGGLVKDPSGTFYGTTAGGGAYYPNGGTVFALAPPATGNKKWSESLVQSFLEGNNESSLIVGQGGVLYGTTATGAGNGLGAVFALTPPGQGQSSWTEAALYSFQGSTDGNGPVAGLVQDASGALYGTTYYGGTGTTCSGGKGCGTVFELTPPAAGQTAWTETILYTFTGGADGGNPYAGLTFDKSGALYGATVYGNPGSVVFKLSPPTAGQTAWAESVLHTFEGGNEDGVFNYGGVIFDPHGDLYGTTLQGGPTDAGTVFKLSPPAAGQTAWTETVLHIFSHNTTDGSYPYAGLVRDAAGNLFGTTSIGGANDLGTVFEVTP